MYLYTSVFSAGMRNIVIQMFFDEYYHENKETLVSAALFFSSLCTALGIIISSKRIEKNPDRKAKIRNVAFMTMAVSISFASMFLVKTYIIYILLFGISSFCINYMYNVFDVFISKSVSEKERELNIRILLSYQMAGYVAGPLFFSCFAENKWLCIAFAIGAQLIGYIAVGTDYINFSESVPSISESAEREIEKYGKDISSAVAKNDRKAMIYCFFMYCASNMLMPSIAYLMKDYLNVQKYAVKSSMFLAAVVIVSSVVIVFAPAAKTWNFRYIPPLSLTVSLALILITKSSNVFLLAFAAIVSGGGYGMFLSGSRYYVNTAKIKRNLVQRYNKVMTVSTLFGYFISVLTGWICTVKNMPVVLIQTCLILVFFTAGIFVSFIPDSKQISGHSAA